MTTQENEHTHGEMRGDISDRDVLNALEAINSSAEFAHANRLKEFLEYVVREALAGRAFQISGRTVAQDVYQRGQCDTPDDSDLSVVRVDAGRLRRRLAQYYAEGGQSDPVRISIPVGSYVPVFEKAPETEQEEAGQNAPHTLTVRSRHGWVIVLSFLTGGLVSLVGLLTLTASPNIDPEKVISVEMRQSALRRALLEKSPTSLQAVNLAEQARALLFPATDPKRLSLVADLFEHVIAMDDDYFGGYAGAAQAYASVGVFLPDGPQKSAYSQKANAFSERSISLRPDSAWAHSSAALVALTERNFEKALRQSETAISLAPEDLYAREIDSLILLFSGNFERVEAYPIPLSGTKEMPVRTASRNALGAAQFHLGDYEGTIEQFELAIAKGDPVSQISVFYLAAAHQAVGNAKQANELVQYYAKAWPGHRVDRFLAHLYHPDVDLKKAVELFSNAGADWTEKH